MSRFLSCCAILFLMLTLQPEAAADGNNASVRVALAQLDESEVGDFGAMLDLALTAKQQGAVLIVFPESSVFGWLNPRVFQDAAPIPGPFASEFSAIAIDAEIWVAVGLAERGPAASGAQAVYHAYDSAVLINPQGEIVLHHRKHNVIENAFDPEACRELFGVDGCSYTVGPLSDIRTVETPFGRTSILVCADAYTYDLTVLQTLKAQDPEFVIVPWGVTAGSQAECGTEGFNATGFAAAAAQYLETAFVVGANAIGERFYGRFLPSWYCGTSGYATPTGEIGGIASPTQSIAYFDIPIGSQ